MNKSTHARWLAKQLPLWVKDGLINDQQADSIQQRYPYNESLLSGRMMINTAAAIMVGLGVIALFAFNWQLMPKLMKLAIIFSALAGVHVAGFKTADSHPLLSETLHALGTMFMGAAIFLVSQIYHLSSHYPNAFILWSAGALAIAWAKPSVKQAFMALILIMTWHLTEIFDFNHPNSEAFPVLIFTVLPLVWVLKSPVLARLTATSLLVSIGFSASWIHDDMTVLVLLLLSACFIYYHDLIKSLSTDLLQHDIGAEMAKPSTVLFIVLMFLFSFPDLLDNLKLAKIESPIALVYLVSFLAISQLLFFTNAIKRHTSAISKLMQITILLVLLPSIVDYYFLPDSFRDVSHLVSILFNILILGASIVLMLDGSRNGNRKRMINGGILLGVLVFMRFADLFDNLIVRGIAFVLTGLFLFWVSRRLGNHSAGEKS